MQKIRFEGDCKAIQPGMEMAEALSFDHHTEKGMAGQEETPAGPGQRGEFIGGNKR